MITAPLARVGDVARQIRGVTYNKEDASRTPIPGSSPIVRAGNITDAGLNLTEDLVWVPSRRIAAEQRIRSGDVVIAASSGSLDVVGKAARATDDWDGGFGAFCKVLRPNDRVDGRYFAHFFRTTSYRRAISALAAGANINNLRSMHLDDLLIPLPVLPEQRRIADILDHADDLRAKRRVTLGHLSTLKQSIFLEMFAGSEPEEWPLTAIEDVADPSSGSIRTGPFGSQLLHGEFVDHGVAVLGIDNAVENQFRWAKLRYISPEKYKLLARYTVHPGDVVITIMGTCGRCAIVPDDIPLAINTKHLCCITLDQTVCLPNFLHSYFLHHPTARHYLRQTAKGAVMDGLNMAIIRQLPLRLPPLPLQESYGRRITAIEAAAVALSQSLARFDDLFSSLQFRAFRGEL